MIARLASFQPLLVSTGTVVLAEIGDKTQLLALVLAARYRKPVPILLGILLATILNHTVAAWVGAWLAGVVPEVWLRWGVVACFLAVAVWTLVPDKLDDDEAKPARFGPFLTTLIAFFLVEIGDKTQIATSLLAAQFRNIALVTLGTTIGMMLANIPAVLLGEAATKVVPLKHVRRAAALLFAVIGVWVVLAAV